VFVTGVSAAGETGTVAVLTDQQTPVTGLAGQGQVGQATTTGDANVFVIGLQASVETNRVLGWGREIPNPGTTWSEDTPSPETIWTEIAA